MLNLRLPSKSFLKHHSSYYLHFSLVNLNPSPNPKLSQAVDPQPLNHPSLKILYPMTPTPLRPPPPASRILLQRIHNSLGILSGLEPGSSDEGVCDRSDHQYQAHDCAMGPTRVLTSDPCPVAGQSIASPNEVTRNSDYCWEST